MTPADVSTIIEPFLAARDRSGLFTDFDGTLAEIVDEPSDASPIPGIVPVLEDLADRYARVAVLSGRPLDFLRQFLDGGLVLAGLYGLEVLVEGRETDHPQSGAWREVIEDVAAHARAVGPEGMKVEPKGLSLTLHYRGNPDIEPMVRSLAEASAARSGLELRPARMSYELHPPIAADKGTALRALAEGLDHVLFIGDDVGDLPAFDALDELAAAGVHVARVAVDSREVSRELVDRADLVLPGPSGVLSLLEELADDRHRRAG